MTPPAEIDALIYNAVMANLLMVANEWGAPSEGGGRGWGGGGGRDNVGVDGQGDFGEGVKYTC